MWGSRYALEPIAVSVPRARRRGADKAAGATPVSARVTERAEDPDDRSYSKGSGLRSDSDDLLAVDPTLRLDALGAKHPHALEASQASVNGTRSDLGDLMARS